MRKFNLRVTGQNKVYVAKRSDSLNGTANSPELPRVLLNSTDLDILQRKVSKGAAAPCLASIRNEVTDGAKGRVFDSIVRKKFLISKFNVFLAYLYINSHRKYVLLHRELNGKRASTLRSRSLSPSATVHIYKVVGVIYVCM